MTAPKFNSKDVRDLPKTGMKRMIENEIESKLFSSNAPGPADEIKQRQVREENYE